MIVRSHPHTPWGEEPQRLPFRVGQSRAQTRRPTHLSPPAERMRGVRSATGRIFELVPTLVHRDDGPPVPVASASEQARLGDARRGCGLAARCLHGTAPPGMARQAVAVAAPVPERAEPALYSLVPATIDRPVAAPQTASRPRFDQHPAAERTGVQEEPSSTLVRRCWYGSTRPTCRDDIERLHKKKRRLPRELVDPKEREDFLRADQLDALLPVLGAIETPLYAPPP